MTNESYLEAANERIRLADELSKAAGQLSKILKEAKMPLKVENAVALLDHAIWRYEKP